VQHGEVQIYIGETGSIARATVASDRHDTFAALQHHRGETRLHLLQHLEAAPFGTLDRDECTDRIHG
jgi:hypothetical protein